MKVEWVMLCRRTEIQEGLLDIYGAGWDLAWSDAFPATLSGSVVLRLGFGDQDARPNGHAVRVQWVDDTDEPFAAPAVIHGIFPDDSHPPNSVLTLIVTFTSLPVRRPGSYRSVVFVDDSIVAELPLSVRKQAGDESAAAQDVPPQAGQNDVNLGKRRPSSAHEGGKS